MDSIKTNKKGRMAAVICRLFGYVILAAVIVSLLPVTVPRFLGYEIYSVASGSMEPEIPVGSLVVVAPVQAEEVRTGDIVAFRAGGAVIVHRVVENQAADRQLVTKGDANNVQDLNPVAYGDLIGVVDRHFAGVGMVLSALTSGVGKVALLMVNVAGLALMILGKRLVE